MAIRLMTAVWDDGSLPRGDVLLMLALADHANDDGLSFPSIARLARRTRSSPSTVRRHLRSLQAEGRLVVDAREGTSNLYRIVLHGDRWLYAHPGQSDTPTKLTPLPTGGRGTPVTAVAGGAVTAVTPEPSLPPKGTNRSGEVSPTARAWVDLRAALAQQHPEVAWRGWTDAHDDAAATQVELHGAPRLLTIAARPTRPDLAIAWLRRWEKEPLPAPARPLHRCPDHGLTHHGVCPGCRADQLAG